MAPKMVYLDDIRPGTIDWKIQVRIIRLWKAPDFNNAKETNSIEMVLLDEKGSKMHATIKRNLMKKFETEVEEGGAYIFENLLVAANEPKFKITNHKYKLNFMGSTKPTKTESGKIPLHHFDFVAFSEILDGKDEGCLIDVIGHVAQKYEMKEIDKNGRKCKLLDVGLEDLESNRVICTLWGDFADQMYEYQNRKDLNGPVIIILQLCKLKSFNGRMGISNAYNGTKLLINPNLNQVSDYKERLADSGKISSSQVVSNMSDHATISLADDLLQTAMMPISDLMEATEDCFCSVLAEVVEVDTDKSWYYESCIKCFKKVQKLETTFYCEYCDKEVIAVPRFKLRLKVIDQTGSTTFIMFDRVASQYLGKSAADLKKLMNKENGSTKTPPELDLVLNKTFLFKVQFSQKWQSFTIKKMSDDNELLKQFRTLHSIKDWTGEKDADLNNSLSPQLNDNIKIVVEGADSNMKVDMPQQMEHNSIECVSDDLENTPSSKTTGKRSVDDIDTSSQFEYTGAQASSTKMPKIVKVKQEPSD